MRGAPAIGCAAAFAVGARLARAAPSADARCARRCARSARRARRRSTWARRSTASRTPIASERDPLAEAQALWAEDLARLPRHRRARRGALPDDGRCSPTATRARSRRRATAPRSASMRAAVAAGKRVRVLADETRPFLQGARLTAWELRRRASRARSSSTAWPRTSCRAARSSSPSSAPTASRATATSPTRSARRASPPPATLRRALLRRRAAHDARPWPWRRARGSPSRSAAATRSPLVTAAARVRPAGRSTVREPGRSTSPPRALVSRHRHGEWACIAAVTRFVASAPDVVHGADAPRSTTRPSRRPRQRLDGPSALTTGP